MAELGTMENFSHDRLALQSGKNVIYETLINTANSKSFILSRFMIHDMFSSPK